MIHLPDTHQNQPWSRRPTTIPLCVVTGCARLHTDLYLSIDINTWRNVMNRLERRVTKTEVRAETWDTITEVGHDWNFDAESTVPEEIATTTKRRRATELCDARETGSPHDRCPQEHVRPCERFVCGVRRGENAAHSMC